jgi:hypothetical protein
MPGTRDTTPHCTTPHWQDLLKHPEGGDHFVQLYQDPAFLADAVAEYIGAGLREGEAAVLIAMREHAQLFMRQLEARGLFPQQAIRRGQLRLLDAKETLARFTKDGSCDWQAFHEVCGGAIAQMRLQYPTVRAYGEMVDVLWQEGKRDEALKLEGFWHRLGKLQTFSLLCAYEIDNLDAGAYGGGLEAVCTAHTHLIPARDYARFNEAVEQASKEVLDQPLAQMLISLSASHRPPTRMPLGQATLFWLKKNMPRTADKVLLQVRSHLA